MLKQTQPKLWINPCGTKLLEKKVNATVADALAPPVSLLETMVLIMYDNQLLNLQEDGFQLTVQLRVEKW